MIGVCGDWLLPTCSHACTFLYIEHTFTRSTAVVLRAHALMFMCIYRLTRGVILTMYAATRVIIYKKRNIT